jgi:hypothetical protein
MQLVQIFTPLGWLSEQIRIYRSWITFSLWLTKVAPSRVLGIPAPLEMESNKTPDETVVHRHIEKRA